MLFIIFMLIFGAFSVEYTLGNKDDRFFRNDYTFIEDTRAFYKFHTLPKSWFDAKQACSFEGAKLFYPEDSHEFQFVLGLWNRTKYHNLVYVGASNNLVNTVYANIEGKPVSTLYVNWLPGEPSGVAPGHKGCITINRYGFFEVHSCSELRPFICKKNLDDLTWNTFCNMPYSDYEYVEKFHKCYKFNPTLMTWEEAYTMCSIEQSYLAVINSKEESDYFKTVLERNGKMKEAHMGFHNRAKEGWQTINGSSVNDSGYSVWSDGQPDNWHGNETCGSMTPSGTLNDVACDRLLYFFCENDIQNYTQLNQLKLN